jgi:hypothetical protein
MSAAYLCCTHMLDMSVLCIEGPNGERIEEPEIQAWCLKKAGLDSGDLQLMAGLTAKPNRAKRNPGLRQGSRQEAGPWEQSGSSPIRHLNTAALRKFPE